MGSVLYRKRASRRSLSKHSGKKKKKNSSHYKSATWLPANVSHVWPPVVEHRTLSLRRPYAETAGARGAEGLPHAGETERSLAHAGHVLRGSPPHTFCFSLSSLTCFPLCPRHPSPKPIAFSLFMCQQHYHGEPPRPATPACHLSPPPSTSPVSDGCFVLPLPFVLLSCLKAICETCPIAG